MKKLFYSLILVVGLSTASTAQVQTTQALAQTSRSNSQNNLQPVSGLNPEQMMNTVKSCPELHAQLLSKFGEKFSFNDKRVMEQLQKNIADKSAAACIRKNSLYLTYGDKYNENKHLID